MLKNKKRYSTVLYEMRGCRKLLWIPESTFVVFKRLGGGVFNVTLFDRRFKGALLLLLLNDWIACVDVVSGLTVRLSCVCFRLLAYPIAGIGDSMAAFD